MKFNILSLGLFSLSSLLPLAPVVTSQASAACVMVDVATQVAIRGSHTPAAQSNDVGMNHDENCFGNVTVDTGTQVSSSPGDVEQSRNSSHYVGGGSEDHYGLRGPVIGVPVETQVDVYSPAHDPSIVNSYGEFEDTGYAEDSFAY
ncbi:MAG: hypothetical protein ACFB4I_10895 [Cyanophyceae cyanobacterium]